MPPTPLRLAATAGITLALLIGAASPALAAQTRALPAGDGLYTLSCGETANQLYAVSASDGRVSTVGLGNSTGQDDQECSVGAAYDASTGRYHYLQYVDGSPQRIRTIDPSNGVSTDGPALTREGNPFLADTLAIGLDGKAYATSSNFPFGTLPLGSRTGLVSVDLDTGAATLIGGIGGSRDYYAAFAVNPSTGVFSVVESRGVLSTIDVTTATLTTVGTVELTDGEASEPQNILSLTIDADGVFWVLNSTRAVDPERLQMTLWSLDPADLATGSQRSGTLATGADADSEINPLTLFVASVQPAPSPIVPAAPVTPTLAETGVNDAASSALASSAALALLLGGVALGVGRARRKARA